MSKYASPPQNSAPFCGGPGPYLIHASLDRPESTLRTASRLVRPFCRTHQCAQQTYRPRDNGDNRPHSHTVQVCMHATDRVALCPSVCVGHTGKPCQNGWTDQMPFALGRHGLNELYIRWGRGSPSGKGHFRGACDAVWWDSFQSSVL